MVGPKVHYLPAEDQHRPLHVLHNDLVLRMTIMQAQALYSRLGARLAAINIVVPGPQMSDYQRRRLHALLREHGVTGDARFPVLKQILGRGIGSTNDLSPAEADECIEVLHRTRPAPTSVPNTESF